MIIDPNHDYGGSCSETDLRFTAVDGVMLAFFAVLVIGGCLYALTH